MFWIRHHREIFSFKQSIIFKIEGAPVSRFRTATEQENISNYTDISKTKTSLTKEADNDLHVAENRHEVKGLPMFNKGYHQEIFKAMKGQQTSEKISNNNIQHRNVQFPVPKAGINNSNIE